MKSFEFEQVGAIEELVFPVDGDADTARVLFESACRAVLQG